VYKENRKEIIYRTNVDDIIVITGGGFLGSLWPYSGGNVYKIFEDFPDNKIVILPQSMFYEDNEEGEKQKQLFYNLLISHKDLSVLFRENISLSRFNAMFQGKVNGYLMPDMALTLDYSQDQGEREGILLCLRNDKESILTEDAKQAIKNHFSGLYETVNESSMHWHTGIMPDKRKEVITGKINELKRHKLVVTDALHCMISCAISGTPCIALNNISGKLEGIYKSWLEDIRYIRYVDSYQELFEMDFASWEELNNKNYYNKSFNKEMEFLAKLIMY